MAQAVVVAGRYIELGQSQTDARYYGYAQAALAPWWELADPPSEVLLLRAAIRQSRHEFEPALQDLSRLLEKDPRDAQAWLMQAVILIVRADYLAPGKPARPSRACAGPSLPSAAWAAWRASPVRQRAATNCSCSQRSSQRGPRRPSCCAWRRCSARRQNGWAIRNAPRPISRGLGGLARTTPISWGRTRNFCSTRRARERWSDLLRDETRVDGLLLRLTLAERAIGDPAQDAHIEELQARFAASRQRGDSLHQGEEARFLLHLADQPEAALALAQRIGPCSASHGMRASCWRRPWLRRPAQAARPALDWMAQTGIEDVALTALAQRLAGAS